MADPFSIYGAIDTSFGFAKIIWDFANAVKDFHEDYDGILVRFGLERVVLQKYMAFFAEEERNIAEDLRAELFKVTAALRMKLDDLSHRIQKRSRGNWRDKVTWPLVRDDILAAEAELGEWVKMMHSWLSHLPDELQAILSEKFTSEDYWGRSKTISFLLASSHMKEAKSAADAKDRQQLVNRFKDSKLANPNAGSFYAPDHILIPDDYQYNVKENEKTEFEVGKLVSVLSNADPRFHIPKAHGYFEMKKGGKDPDDKEGTIGYAIVYERPTHIIETMELAQMIKDTAGSTSLTQRVRIALELTAAVAYVHAVGWVHELIRPDKILLCYDRDDLSSDEGGLGHVNLFGFGNARRSSGEVISHRSEDIGDWTVELYCHPERQHKTLLDSAKSNTPVKRFNFKHDIYGLGVALLEIGLWQELVEVVKKEMPEAELVTASVTKRCELLRKIAGQLPRMTGDLYAEIVMDCLKVDDTRVSMKQVLERLEGLRL